MAKDSAAAAHPLTLLAPGEQLAALLRINELVRHLMQNIEGNLRKLARAIEEVRDVKLYLLTHNSFDAWVRDVLRKSPSWAYQVLQVLEMPAIVNKESHARVLAGHDPETQAAALELAGPSPTALKLQAALDEIEIQKTRTEEAEAKKAPRHSKTRAERLMTIRRCLRKALRAEADTIDEELHKLLRAGLVRAEDLAA